MARKRVSSLDEMTQDEMWLIADVLSWVVAYTKKLPEYEREDVKARTDRLDYTYRKLKLLLLKERGGGESR